MRSQGDPPLDRRFSAPLARSRSYPACCSSLGAKKIEVDKSNAAEYGKKTTVWAHRTNAPVVIEKEWGRSDGEPGDYIIVGPNDDAYMCNAELFESTYELLPGHAHKYVKTGTVLARKMTHDFMAETSTGVQHVRGAQGAAAGWQGDRASPAAAAGQARRLPGAGRQRRAVDD